MITKRLTLIGAALAGALLASGCGKGSAPSLSSFTILTLPVTRGATELASIVVSDPEGLGGLTMKATLSGPVSGSFPLTPPASIAAYTAVRVRFSFRLSTANPAGNYTLAVTATDKDGNTSAPLSTSFTVR